MASNNYGRFSGKVALVVGGSYGMGYAVAERLALEGAKVVLCSRKVENVKEAERKLRAQGLEAKGVTCHVSDEAQRKELMDAAREYGGLDILFVNTGVNPIWAGILDCPESVWDKVFDVNLKASFLLSQEALPLLKRSKAGRIIYMSTTGTFNQEKNLGAYTIAKTGVLSLTKMASMQLGKYNITVNCVVPGLIDTRFSKILVTDDRKERFLKTITLGRAGEPQEVASLVAFLASEEAGFITGENIFINGGMPGRL